MENSDNTDSFEISYKDFLDLSEIERDDILKNARKEHREFVNNFFEKNPEADWVLIPINLETESLRISGNLNAQPDANYLHSMQEIAKMPLFCYSREDDWKNQWEDK